jgi:hypothetical protein
MDKYQKEKESVRIVFSFTAVTAAVVAVMAVVGGHFITATVYGFLLGCMLGTCDIIESKIQKRKQPTI